MQTMCNLRRLLMTLFIVMLSLREILVNDTSCYKMLAAESDSSSNKSHSANTSQITNCVRKLNYKNLTKSDAAYIWHTIIKIFNGISNIPEETLLVLRGVIPAIKVSDYENITFSQIDMIQNFGMDYNLTNEQLSAIAERILKDSSSKQPEDYTVYDLKALRNILCGFNVSDINRIHPLAYKDASEEVGRLKCKSEVMTAFATLAVDEEAYGPAERWNEDIIRSVGRVAKYLPRNVRGNIHVLT